VHLSSASGIFPRKPRRACTRDRWASPDTKRVFACRRGKVPVPYGIGRCQAHQPEAPSLLRRFSRRAPAFGFCRGFTQGSFVDMIRGIGLARDPRPLRRSYRARMNDMSGYVLARWSMSIRRRNREWRTGTGHLRRCKVVTHSSLHSTL